MTTREEFMRDAAEVLRSAATPDDVRAKTALGLLAAEDERQSKLHDLLETIREQIEAALRVFVGHYASWMDEHPDNVECCVHARHTFGDIRKALAALQQSPPQGETK